MNTRIIVDGLTLIVLSTFPGSVSPSVRYMAHCDGLDGPVVKAAQRALDTGKIGAVLFWVSEKDEAEVKAAFAQARTVRKAGPEAKQLADRFFFETVVRLHRTAEGASYTGLKPAGRDLGPAIPAADKAIADGSCEALSKLLVEVVQDGLRDRFKEVMKHGNPAPDDIPAGRRSVHSYVEFIHFVERLYESARSGAPGHFAEGHERDSRR